MIEFNGYISGDAKKFFLKKERKTIRSLMLVSLLLVSPILFSFFSFSNKFGLYFLCSVIVLIFIFPYVPRSKKEIKSIIPNKIFVYDDLITCVAEKYSESQYIERVKKVYDYGDFYELIFPIYRGSDKFVCQKSLLTKGTLAEFEALFSEKIERKT